MVGMEFLRVEGGELAEMVAEVGDVVLDEEAEGERAVGGVPEAREVGGVDVLDDVGEVEVDDAPGFEELVPAAEVVALDGDPGLLRVAGEMEVGVELEADETLVVVVGGVDEVADDLFDAPAVGF